MSGADQSAPTEPGRPCGTGPHAASPQLAIGVVAGVSGGDIGVAETGRDPGAIREDPRAAAFFDLDNTVIQGASLFHLAKGLYRRKFFPTRVIFKALWLQAYFRIVGRENPQHIEDARKATLLFIRGHTVTELEEVGNEIYEESIASRIWPGTRAIAQHHLDVGQQVWLVTAAPVEVAGIIAARLGLTGALATTAEHLNGVYTGELNGELLHGPAKAEAIRALAAEHGLDLSRCFAYSDSYNDLPMLSLVGHPCAINPDGRLQAHAEENDWQIRDYRTGRRVVRLSLFGAGAAGASAGAVAVGLAMRRYVRSRLRQPGLPTRRHPLDEQGRQKVQGVAEETEDGQAFGACGSAAQLADQHHCHGKCGQRAGTDVEKSGHLLGGAGAWFGGRLRVSVRSRWTDGPMGRPHHHH